jgi:hypothetical protein
MELSNSNNRNKKSHVKQKKENFYLAISRIDIYCEYSFESIQFNKGLSLFISQSKNKGKFIII